MTNDSIAISAVVITLNEQKHLPDCLKSLQWIDDILVVDAGSTDNTAQIAGEYGARVIHQGWEGYVAQRRFALSRAKHAWVLSIDADERVTPELKDEIISLIPRLQSGSLSGFHLFRLNHFMSRPIYHCGWHPDRVMRLFRKDRVSLCDVSVHEGYDVQGQTGQLNGFLHHFSYDSLHDYFEKMNRYTSLEAGDKLKRKGSRIIHWYHMPAHATSRFLRMYIIKKGFRDGFTGFLVCFVSSIYLFVLYAKMWEIQRKK